VRGDPGGADGLEPLHGTDNPFESQMILPQQIVKVLD
jgi:hypothetical protein